MKRVIFCGLVLGACLLARAAVVVEEVGKAADERVVELRGVGAGEARAEWWAKPEKLNWVPDARSPLIEPLAGRFRNIYAPSVVAMADGTWRVFYGGWDGTETGNDRIYSVDTADFLSFTNRRTVVEHGDFQHVCNVSAVREGDGFRLMCTGFPDAVGLNKPVEFAVGREASGPGVATRQDLVRVDGYELFDRADINGMNVLVRDGDGWRLYFGDFRNFNGVYLATSADGRSFRYAGMASDFRGVVNDVKRVGERWLMGLHRNGPELFCGWSTDPAKFGEVRRLATNLGPADRYIVAIGWVVSEDGKRVLGFLYGAGAASSLDQNRIFARWLQRKVVFVTEDGHEIVGRRAVGPDRVLLDLDKAVRGRLRVSGEEGHGELGVSATVTLTAGHAYAVRW